MKKDQINKKIKNKSLYKIKITDNRINRNKKKSKQRSINNKNSYKKKIFNNIKMHGD